MLSVTHRQVTEGYSLSYQEVRKQSVYITSIEQPSYSIHKTISLSLV